ncbi:hypothetical protein [Melissospora conviva]|uniref:hypothetical protein n=1 Tax=Melissospora conviva TaxID=3388432 RepID=UPI003C27F60F
MAVVGEIFKDVANAKRHPTVVECGWQIVRDGDKKLLQLSSYGSDQRASGKKVSQTLQFDRETLAALIKIAKQAFPDLDKAD